MNSLNNAITDAKATHIPRKKFAFKRKAKAKALAAAASVTGACEAASGSAALSEVEEAVRRNPDRAFANLADQENVLEKAPLSFEPGADFVLFHLDNCKVSLKERVGTLRLERLRNCSVTVGAVTRSIFVNDCEGCTFVFSSQQLRIHNCTSVDFYVHMRSGPIIEDCTKLRFAPTLAFTFPEMAAQRADAGLDFGLDGNQWADVKDFKWLRREQSPNWCIIPEAERDSQL